MNNIVITTTSFGVYDNAPLELFNEKGFTVIINPYRRKVKPDELVELAKNAVGLIAGTESITENVLLKLPDLKVISRCGVGIDNVNVNATNRLGIKVYNTPDAPTFAVAELTVGLILTLMRKVNQMDNIIRSGGWEKRMGNLLYGKNIGIIGFGRIGQKVGELLSTFGVELAYYDKETKHCSINCGEKRFEEILSWADIFTLHVSHSSKCGPIIGDREIRLMKKGSWIINVSRGEVVDEEALYHALKGNYLSGAAIDVFKREPYSGPLKELDNIVLTPHIGSYAKESRIEMEKQAVKNLLIGLKDSGVQFCN